MSVIYEVTLSVDREIVDEFDDWLATHTEEMLELPGFTGAQVYETDDDEQGRARRVTHYELPGRAELDEYLAGPANAMRQSGIDRFGDRMHASRRILSPGRAGHALAAEIKSCMNCGTALSGQYCGSCGQRARNRMISVWELTRDAFGDLFELDSRLWRSLIPLLNRPGKLTRDYLEGRRARYMPPFRTYLVLSIVFFLVAFFDPRENFGFLFEAAVAPTAEEQAEERRKAGEALSEIRENIVTELEQEGILEEHLELAEHLQKELSTDAEETPGINLKIPTAEDPDGGFTITLDDDGEAGNCDTGDLSDGDIPDWLAKRLTPERLQAICDKVIADDGESLIDKLVENIPAGLIFLLPLMALALKMLYPLSKRYYVEHLLFFVHFHAFFFLILILMISFDRFANAVSLNDGFISLILFTSSLYIPIYLYKAMRKVYSQGHSLTIPKYVALVFMYAIGFLLMFLFALLLAAFSI
jgi:hypothetical protein